VEELTGPPAAGGLICSIQDQPVGGLVQHPGDDQALDGWATQTELGRSGSGPLGHGHGPSEPSGTRKICRLPDGTPDSAGFYAG
jgi:hypothetical protein